jgi:hypothetical protein
MLLIIISMIARLLMWHNMKKNIYLNTHYFLRMDKKESFMVGQGDQFLYFKEARKDPFLDCYPMKCFKYS